MKTQLSKQVLLIMLTVPVLALTLPGCGWAVDSSEVNTEGARNVAELLRKPIYNTEVITYGTISSLDETTLYFELTSAEETIRVWYDSMVNKDGTQSPRGDLEGIRNGHKAVVRGELKEEAGKYHEKDDFWASEVCVPCYIPGGQWME
jgi:hypothetical protein